MLLWLALPASQRALFGKAPLSHAMGHQAGQWAATWVLEDHRRVPSPLGDTLDRAFLFPFFFLLLANNASA